MTASQFRLAKFSATNEFSMLDGANVSKNQTQQHWRIECQQNHAEQIILSMQHIGRLYVLIIVRNNVFSQLQCRNKWRIQNPQHWINHASLLDWVQRQQSVLDWMFPESTWSQFCNLNSMIIHNFYCNIWICISQINTCLGFWVFK